MENMHFYDKKNIELQMQKSEDITFINVTILNKTEILKIEVETYEINTDNNSGIGKKMDSLSIICYDEKRRRPATLEKIGATREDLLNGMKEPDFAKILSEYFIMHDGIIVSYKTYTQIAALNKIIQKYKYKSIENTIFDMRMMTKYCRESYIDKESIDNTKEAFCFCMRKYRRLEKLEQNKYSCVVNYAYYWISEYRNYMEWICCNTSIGVIYYDILSERWGITKKESKKTGLLIESVDVDDVKKQLFIKYRVNNMEELKNKLKERREAQQAV